MSPKLFFSPSSCKLMKVRPAGVLVSGYVNSSDWFNAQILCGGLDSSLQNTKPAEVTHDELVPTRSIPNAARLTLPIIGV